MTAPALHRTPLHALHVELGARLVPFAGYEMPVQYPTGIIKEHLHTRASAGLFDVSHMGQVRVSGDRATNGLEALLPIDVVGLPAGRQRYGFLTNEHGGILDDLMVTRSGDDYLLVVNAARKSDDIAHLRARLPTECSLERLDTHALLALQGPAAAGVLARFAPEIEAMAFMDARVVTLAGIACLVSRSGYTGEDGFEISLPGESAEVLARALLAEPGVAPVGLGARDSLRLEAGLCLYGNDIDAETTPVEANLAWVLPRVRRPGGARAGGYPGADVIACELADGPARLRVGLAPRSRAPVRAGTELLGGDGRRVGVVTSGGFGPTLGAPVAMGYVEPTVGAVGTALAAVVRGNAVAIDVAAMPAVPHRYRRAA